MIVYICHIATKELDVNFVFQTFMNSILRLKDDLFCLRLFLPIGDRFHC